MYLHKKPLQGLFSISPYCYCSLIIQKIPFNMGYIDKDNTDITKRHFTKSANFVKILQYKGNTALEGRHRFAKP